MLTDHKPLTYALTTHSNNYTPRQTRHLDYISQFTSDIRHVTGVDNIAADDLSRLGVSTLHEKGTPIIDLVAMACAQAEDLELQTLQSSSCSLTACDSGLV